MTEDTQTDLSTQEPTQEATAPETQAEATNTLAGTSQPDVEATQQPVVTDTAPQETPVAILPEPTFEEVQKAMAARIATLSARVTALVAINGPAALDMVEHQIVVLEQVAGL
jgi:hypothetical protein